MKVDYRLHDRAYARMKADGQSGWVGHPDQDKRAEVRVAVDSVLRAYSAAGREQPGRLLELGCGAGDIGLVLAAAGFEVHGIDISATAVAWANEKRGRTALAARFCVGDVSQLPYGPARFDLVVDGHCLHCIIGGDRQRMLGEALRVLHPGGLLVVMSMCGDPANAAVKRVFDPVSRCLVVDGVATRYLGLPEDIRTEVREAGFEIVRSIVHPPLDDDDQATVLIEALRPSAAIPGAPRYERPT